jgi:acyl-homoserine lactone acylase PvdQ
MTTEEKIKVMQAFVDGKDVQYRDPQTGMFFSAGGPNWNWGRYEYRIKPEEKEKTLKERIEEEFPDKDVIMLEWFGNYPTRCLKANGMLHIDAQSTEAFAGYVYALNNVFKVSLRPCIWDGKLQKYIQHPVAVLLGR